MSMKKGINHLFQSVIILVFLSSLLFLSTVNIGASPEQYTHGVLDEIATSTHCSTCNRQVPKIHELYDALDGMYIPVEFHLQDEWQTKDGFSFMTKHGITGTPTHVFDGGYYKMGGILSEKWIEKAGTRATHRVELAIAQEINGNTVNYFGSIRELDGRPLQGLLRVYIVENHLLSQNKEWNSVFRDYGIEQEISVPSNDHELFKGSWQAGQDHIIENIMVVASVWETDELGKLYAIQATNTEYSMTPITDTNTTLTQPLSTQTLSTPATTDRTTETRQTFTSPTTFPSVTLTSIAPVNEEAGISPTLIVVIVVIVGIALALLVYLRTRGRSRKP